MSAGMLTRVSVATSATTVRMPSLNHIEAARSWRDSRCSTSGETADTHMRYCLHCRLLDNIRRREARHSCENGECLRLNRAAYPARPTILRHFNADVSTAADSTPSEYAGRPSTAAAHFQEN